MRILIAALLATATPALAEDADPYLWMEEVEGARALDQVKAWNAATSARLANSPEFEALKAEMQAILEDDSRIAEPDDVFGDTVTNLWTDAEHRQGLWRASALSDYAASTPRWQTLIDLDALSTAESRKWVWKGATCLAPRYARCLVSLSDGGSDAVVWREFDVPTASFVARGFTTPNAKTSIAWVDLDTVLVATADGGDVTESGYARTARLWRRGTPMATARAVLSGKTSDVSVSVASTSDGRVMRPRIVRAVDFWTSTEYHYDGGAPKAWPLPGTATREAQLGDRVIALLHKDWQGFKAGTLVAYRIGEDAVEPLFAPFASQSIEAVIAGSDRVYVSLLEDVAGRLVALDRGDAGWAASPVAVPPNSVVSLLGAGGSADTAFFKVENFASPETLMVTRSGGEAKAIAALKPMFDPAAIEVSQRFATSKDGTRIPYFVVRPAGATGPLPTIMHAYGGFRNAQKPTYLTKNPYQIGPGALFWLKAGGSFAIANIRGGGEYGPAWHEGALREKRQNSYDDLYAVGEALKAGGLASKLGVSGRSQGGMLVGVAMTQRPDLFDAIIMGVPLADMKRYNKLLAGASWMGEYGNPDVPDDWAFIGRYSPYQKLTQGIATPPAIIYTSTKDDRVHPGHARKMAAKLEAYGRPFEYYENIEGGHAGASDAGEHAWRAALMYMFAKRELMAK